MGGRINYSGLVIAGLGFFLTRFTVTLAIYEDPVRFYFAGVVPLVLGLSLAAFGVALAVLDVRTSLVRTTALWCVVGTGTMLVLVVLTLVGSNPGQMLDLGAVQSRTYLSNFLIGGSVGGTLTGLYAARNRRQRSELRQQTNRLEVLNRLLRHEVLNSLTAIRGYATLTEDESAKARQVITDRSDAIESSIEEVKYLARSAETAERGAIDLRECLDASVATVREEYPEADIAVGAVPEDLRVLANERIDRVFVNLLENAIVHARTDEPSVEVSVATTPGSARVSVRDEGPGLPDSERALLETGDIGEFDYPQSGFGLDIVRLLIENYRGAIDTAVDEDGTTITVEVPRANVDRAGLQPSPTSLTGVQPSLPHLLVTFGAAILAGVAYGLVSLGLGSPVAAIGVFYGIENAVVGWLTHEFHSVVFGFVFAGLVTLAPSPYREDVRAHLAIGVAWGVVLWLVAAGIVSAVWLRLLGVPAPIPNLSGTLLVNHVVWGLVLGLSTALGYGYVVPRLSALRARLPGRLGRE
jgi:signal transduction histidine kinase